MPVSATYSKAIIADARKAESLTKAQADKILAAAPDGWLATLKAHADGKPENGPIADWKAAFPTLLANLSDVDASFLIRVAVAAAGGVAV